MDSRYCSALEECAEFLSDKEPQESPMQEDGNVGQGNAGGGSNWGN